MLYALGDPVSLLILVASFVVAVTLHGLVQGLVAARAGDRSVVPEGRTGADPRRHVDPFGAVAAAIGGIGWTKPVGPLDPRSTNGTFVMVLLSGALINLFVGLGALVGFRLGGGIAPGAGSLNLQYGIGGGSLGLRALLLFGLSNVFVGLLSLVPIPPMDGGRLLFALAPKTAGWNRAKYQLDDRNIGIAIMLALVIIPLGGPQPLLPTVLDTLVGPLVRAVVGG